MMPTTDQPNLTEESAPLKSPPHLLKKIFLGVGAGLVILILSLVVWSNYQLSIFTQATGVSQKEIIDTLKSGWNHQPTQSDGYVNILVLGLDSLTTRGNSLPLTDSMMLASINLNQAQVKLLPLPRDLWSVAYQTKINALYTYGLERYPDRPIQFPQEVISQLTDVELHYALAISMDHVAELIDLIGGIEIDVQHPFIDEEFPRTDVDVTTTTDPQLLYETVEFKPGLQTMTGETALKYMRSRHGSNDENTDNSRSQRQQEVMQSLLATLTSRDTMTDLQLLGKLYRYYLDNFSQEISPEEIISLAKKLAPSYRFFNLENHSLRIYPDDETGTIEHPAQYLYDGQWVYTIRNQDEFKQDIQQQLFN